MLVCSESQLPMILSRLEVESHLSAFNPAIPFTPPLGMLNSMLVVLRWYSSDNRSLFCIARWFSRASTSWSYSPCEAVSSRLCRISSRPEWGFLHQTDSATTSQAGFCFYCVFMLHSPVTRTAVFLPDPDVWIVAAQTIIEAVKNEEPREGILQYLIEVPQYLKILG